MESVSRQMARGGMWMLLFKVADRALAVISTAVLARLLTPADFGLVAMATSLIAAIELMTSFGFDIALLRDQDVSRARYDSAWTLNGLLGVSCALVLLALTLPAVRFYAEPRLLTLIPLLALGTAVQGFENIGTVAFRKQLDFRREFVFLTVKRIATFLASLCLALWLRSYWALALAIVVSRVGGVLISYAMHSYRPRWSLAQARDLLHYSKWLLMSNLVGFLTLRMPDFMIGRLAGPHQVGLYSAATEISRIPTTEIAAPINRAVYPGYAKQANNVAALCADYMKVASAIWTLALPAALGLWFVAQPFVLLFMGGQWLEMVPAVRVLTFAGLCGVIVSNQSYVYLALGRGSIVTRLYGIHLVVSFIGMLMLLPKSGIVGVAYAVLAASILDVPLSFVVFQRVSRMQWSALLQSAWRPVIASAAMFAVLQLLHPGGAYSAGETESAALMLLSTASIGAVAYLVALLITWLLAGRPAGPERQAFALLQQSVLSRRAPQRTRDGA
jgi:lipopolysaccharide exporter